MKVLEFLGNVGGALLSTHPMGAAAVSVINAVTGKEVVKKEMTGKEALDSVNSQLSPDQQLQIAQLEIEANVEHDQQWTKRFKHMDTGKMSWVRPFIVLKFSFVVDFVLIFYFYTIYDIFKGVLEKQGTTEAALSMAVSSIGSTWPVVAAAIAFPIAIIRSWFGFREKEKQRAAELANNQAVSPLTGVLESIAKAFK